MLRIYIFISLFAGLLGITACNKKPVISQAAAGSYTLLSNIAYGSNSAQNFSLYMPGGASRCPLILLVHGGGWVRGQAPAFYHSDLYNFFISHGYAIADMNYRLADVYPYPAPLDDIDSLLQYLSRNADRYAIDARRVCLFGQSAGAHLSLLYAYARNTKQQIKVVIDAFGPADLCDSTVQADHLRVDLGTFLQNQSYSANPALWFAASPINYMKHALPTIIYQGTADTTVYPIQSERLNDSLEAHGIPHQINRWNGCDHGWYDAMWDISRSNTLLFLQAYL
jgi:acetyl esterase/lipase